MNRANIPAGCGRVKTSKGGSSSRECGRVRSRGCWSQGRGVSEISRRKRHDPAWLDRLGSRGRRETRAKEKEVMSSKRSAIAVLVVASAALVFAGIALAADASTKVTIQAQQGGFFGLVHTKNSAAERCE